MLGVDTWKRTHENTALDHRHHFLGWFTHAHGRLQSDLLTLRIAGRDITVMAGTALAWDLRVKHRNPQF